MNRKPSFRPLLAAALLAASLPAAALQFNPITRLQSAPVGRFATAGDARYVVAGDRIFRSVDAGATWTMPGQPPGGASRVAALGTRLYAISGAKLLSSTDDGANWSDFSGNISGEISELYAAGGALFAIAGEFVNNSFVQRLWRGDGQTASWTEVTPSGVTQMERLLEAGTRLCLSAGNGGIRWSADNGTTWATSSGVNGQFNAFAVSPDGATVLAAPASNSIGIRRSINGCQNFANVSTSQAAPPGGSLRALGIDAAGAYYVGFDSGTILRSTDNGSTYSVDNSAALPAGTQVSTIDFSPFGTEMLVATGGRGVFSNAGGAWVARNSGLSGAAISALIPRDADADAIGVGLSGGYTVSDDAGALPFVVRNDGLALHSVGAVLRAGNTLIAATRGQVDFSVFPNTGTPGLFRSTDDGASWTQAGSSSGLPDGASVDALAAAGGAFYAAISNAIDFNARGVYKSTDDGLTWTKLTALGTPSTRNLATRGTTLFVYVGNSGVLRSADGGASFTAVNNGLNGSKFGKVFASSNAVFASAGGVVFRSLDDGDNWSATTGFAISKFGIEILSLAEDDDGVLYLGDEHAGLSVSTDGGATWTPDSDGLLQAETCIPRINALLFKAGKIYAGLGGPGLFVASKLGTRTPGDSVACTTNIDTFVDAFSFTAQNNVTPDTLVMSNTITVSGLGDGVTVPVSVTGGEYAIGCAAGSFTAAAGTVSNGDMLCLRHRSAATGETAVTTTLTISDRSAAFTSRTGLVYTGREDEINTGFGSNGFATLSGFGTIADTLVQPDGSLIAAGKTPGFSGDYSVARLNADGSADNSFGTSGRVVIDFGGNDTLTKVLRQSDGKLVLIGYSFSSTSPVTSQVAMARLNTDGSLDGTFGDAGKVLFDINPSQNTQRNEIVGSGALLADGSIIAAGGIVTNSSGVHYFAAKFSASGAIDTTFGSGTLFAPGVGSVQVGSSTSASGNAVAVQADGKLVIAGQSQVSFGTIRGVVARLNADGSVDTAFGSNGAFAVPDTITLTAVVIDAAGKALVAGSYRPNSSVLAPLVARLTTAGALDTGFAGDGTLIFDTLTGDFFDLIALADGRYAAVGRGRVGGSGDLVALYTIFNADGTLDSSFGSNGQGYVLRGPVNGNAVTGASLTQRADGGVVVGGAFGSDAALYVFGGQGGGGGGSSDTTPDPFSFTDVMDVEPGSVQVSNTITVAGIDAASPLSVVGGEYSLNGGAYSSAAATVVAGDTVSLRHTASSGYSDSVDTTLTIGGVADTFTSTTRAGDAMPDAFSFADQMNVEPNAEVMSNIITVSGIEVAVPVSVSGGVYRINGGAYTGDPGMVVNGDTLQVSHTASSAFSTSTDTVLTVGGVSDTFTSTTRADVVLDTTPDAFSFTAVQNAEPATPVESNTITVSGIDAPSPVSVSGGEYRIGSGAYTSASGSVNNGDTVTLRLTSGSFGQTRTAMLSIGGVSATFSVSTRADTGGGGGGGGGGGSNSGSVPDASGGTINVATSAGALEDLRRIAQPAAAPSGFQFPNGFFGFRITGLAPGASATVNLTLPASARPSSVVKCLQGACGEFPANISGNVVTLTLTDGGAGDADGVADGIITDPVAPAIRIQTVTSSGGGGFGWLTVLLGLAAGIARRSRRS